METISYKNYSIKIENDVSAENPINDMDFLGTFIMFHKKYSFGHKNLENFTPKSLEKYCNKKDIIALPVYMYDHSGITIKTNQFSCHWDSGKIGYIFASKEKVKKEYNVKKISAKLKTKIFEYLNGEIQLIDNYLTGNVYGYTILDNKENELDSCWGFYGYNHEKSGLLELAKSTIDSTIKHIESNEGIQESLPL